MADSTEPYSDKSTLRTAPTTPAVTASDAITKAAGYQTLRFQSKNKPSIAELAELFAKVLPSLKS